MKRTISMLAIAGLCSVGAAFAAQTPAPAPTTPAPTAKPAKPAKPAKAEKMAAMTYTGCVDKGSKPNTYELKDATAAGSTDKATYDVKGGGLKAHLNHKVEVTGTVTKPATGNSVLTAKKVKMVAPSCS